MMKSMILLFLGFDDYVAYFKKEINNMAFTITLFSHIPKSRKCFLKNLYTGAFCLNKGAVFLIVCFLSIYFSNCGIPSQLGGTFLE